MGFPHLSNMFFATAKLLNWCLVTLTSFFLCSEHSFGMLVHFRWVVQHSARGVIFRQVIQQPLREMNGNLVHSHTAGSVVCSFFSACRALCQIEVLSLFLCTDFFSPFFPFHQTFFQYHFWFKELHFSLFQFMNEQRDLRGLD